MQNCYYNICKKSSSAYYAEITYKQPDGTIKRISRSTRCKRKYDAIRRMEEMIAKLERDLSTAEKDFNELIQFIWDWLEKVESKEIEATTLENVQNAF